MLYNYGLILRKTNFFYTFNSSSLITVSPFTIHQLLLSYYCLISCFSSLVSSGTIHWFKSRFDFFHILYHFLFPPLIFSYCLLVPKLLPYIYWLFVLLYVSCPLNNVSCSNTRTSPKPSRFLSPSFKPHSIFKYCLMFQTLTSPSRFLLHSLSPSSELRIFLLLLQTPNYIEPFFPFPFFFFNNMN